MAHVYSPIIPFPGTAKRLNNPLHRYLLSTLFTKARKQKEPTYASAAEWMMKMCHIYTMGFYSHVKNNIILTFANK